jgi:hypothetical protein
VSRPPSAPARPPASRVVPQETDTVLKFFRVNPATGELIALESVKTKAPNFSSVKTVWVDGAASPVTFKYGESFAFAIRLIGLSLLKTPFLLAALHLSSFGDTLLADDFRPRLAHPDAPKLRAIPCRSPVRATRVSVPHWRRPVCAIDRTVKNERTATACAGFYAWDRRWNHQSRLGP